MAVKDLLKGVSHMKNSTVRIVNDRVIYFDPIEIMGEPKDADILFISHIHHDHFSIEDIRKLVKRDTTLVMPEDCARSAVEAGLTGIVAVRPSKSYKAAGLPFDTVPAYNIGKRFHKKESNWVGYVAEINGTRFYFAGDTDRIPEMKDVHADVAFLPVGGTYTMTAEEAAEAANLIHPSVAVPVHFADVAGTVKDAGKFIAGLDPSIKGIILKKL